MEGFMRSRRYIQGDASGKDIFTAPERCQKILANHSLAFLTKDAVHDHSQDTPPFPVSRLGGRSSYFFFFLVYRSESGY